MKLPYRYWKLRLSDQSNQGFKILKTGLFTEIVTIIIGMALFSGTYAFIFVGKHWYISGDTRF